MVRSYCLMLLTALLCNRFPHFFILFHQSPPFFFSYTEVARTRLREEGHKYRSFFQTIFLVYREEGIRNGLYRGLVTQLLRKYFDIFSFYLILTFFSLHRTNSQHRHYDGDVRSAGAHFDDSPGTYHNRAANLVDYFRLFFLIFPFFFIR